jgi:hypothetical protein
MRGWGRDRYKGVPESELPDAIVEIDRKSGTACVRSSYSNAFDTLIYFCPWCGARIGKHPEDEAFEWPD